MDLLECLMQRLKNEISPNRVITTELKNIIEDVYMNIEHHIKTLEESIAETRQEIEFIQLRFVKLKMKPEDVKEKEFKFPVFGVQEAVNFPENLLNSVMRKKKSDEERNSYLFQLTREMKEAAVALEELNNTLNDLENERRKRYQLREHVLSQIKPQLENILEDDSKPNNELKNEMVREDPMWIDNMMDIVGEEEPIFPSLHEIVGGETKNSEPINQFTHEIVEGETKNSDPINQITHIKPQHKLCTSSMPASAMQSSIPHQDSCQRSGYAGYYIISNFSDFDEESLQPNITDVNEPEEKNVLPFCQEIMFNKDLLSYIAKERARLISALKEAPKTVLDEICIDDESDDESDKKAVKSSNNDDLSKKEKFHENVGTDKEKPKQNEKNTEELREIIQNVLNRNDDEKLDGVNSSMLILDIRALIGEGQINDAIIDKYSELIFDRSKLEGYPSCHIFSSHFYKSYSAGGYKSVEKWTKNVDIFQLDFTFFPLLITMASGNHWCFLVVEHKRKHIYYYDSVYLKSFDFLSLVLLYLHEEHLNKKGHPSELYKVLKMEDIPRQENGRDCGVFLMEFMENISRKGSFKFTQADIISIRQRIAYELIRKELCQKMDEKKIHYKWQVTRNGIGWQ